MSRDIKLSGGEISVLKTIGLGGTQVYGKLLLDKLETAERAEFLETLSDLISLGYVLSTKVNVREIADIERSFFRVSPVHSRELRDAVNPSKTRDKDRARRQRRS